MNENDKINREWNISIMKFIVIFAVIICCGEILMVIYNISNGLVQTSTLLCVLQKIILPSSINLYIICISFLTLGSRKVKNRTKTGVPVISMLLVCFNYLIFHHDTPVCIISLILPIMLSINNSNSKAIKGVAFLCSILASLITAIILLLYYKYVDLSYIISALLSLVFVLGIIYILTCMSKVEAQKNKLLISSLKERNYYKTKSSIDVLTKCNNNAAYRSKMDENMHKHNNMCLAIIDIDKFKSVNDTYGHANGDVVLKQLGVLLNKMNSEEVFTARYGGEEFVILFFNHTLEQAEKIMNKERLKFEHHIFPELNNKNCTFSCGIAKELKGDKPVDLFKKADAALYVAKETGRNKVVKSEIV